MTTRRAYEIMNTLGRGGFGTVYKAHLKGDGGFCKPVALKVLNPKMAEQDEIAQRLRDEARVLGLVRHRAIVTVDGLVKLDGRWAVIMEYVEGVDLQTVVAQQRVPTGVALEIVSEVAGALHAAWTRTCPMEQPLHLVHRDIKPANIRVTPMGEVMVLDFGIAVADFRNREAHTHQLTFGSIDYMAPERIDMIDEPSGDIYSLGCVLYELLSGGRIGRSFVDPERHHGNVEKALAELQIQGDGPRDELLGFLRSMLSYKHEHRPAARDVERRCAYLGRWWMDERLRDWAEDEVPKLIPHQTQLPPDQWTGSTLYEEHSAELGEDTLATPPAPAPTTPIPAPDEVDLDAPTEWVQLDPITGEPTR
jgi:serine/threonine protein kinase